ncbi:rRNA processing/ribosome biogenesis [Rhizoctonia solani]|uniref:rRNA processing/ribosome biogenesis n=1 Tax=Rhizoctonia solani TaxID=456999 RepID=A0A8H7INA6_9AGAM|nr:rRNA processing/ribosome biogenesis [Rhizoctonia solani]
MSTAKHPLELVLQNHLGADESAIKYLPNVLTVLQQPGILQETRVLGKWNARINSFLHSREAASRWVGLYIARYTALGSRQILIDNAQGWVGVVLPMLSKPESPPNHYSAIRLLSYIFTAVTDMPEFQRQVVVPNVQKCSQALLAIAKNSESELDLKLLAIDTLTKLTTYHPTHHKALHQQLLNFTLEHLQGSFPVPSSPSFFFDNQLPLLVTSVIKLHAVLALTGGKVGAGMMWRQSLDSTIGTIWATLSTLRSTYADVPRPSTITTPFSLPELPADSAVAGPIALDRFRSMIHLLIDLLRTPTSRPVSIPLGQLSHLTLALLRFNANSQSQSTNATYEAVQRANEDAIVPDLCAAGCMLAQQLAKTCGKLFTPYASQVFTAITLKLEQNITTELQARLLATIPPIIASTHTPAPSASYNRLAARILKVLSPLLPSSRTHSQAQPLHESGTKGKKRARYEGDELFSSHSSSTSSSPLSLPTHDKLHMAALFALAALIPTLPHTTQATLGGSPSGMLGVAVQALSAIEQVSYGPTVPLNVATECSATDVRRTFYTWHRSSPHRSIILASRVPPDSKSGPTIENVLLFWKDEEDEETKEFRHTAEIAIADEILASELPLEASRGLNGAKHAMNDLNEETLNVEQSTIVNGIVKHSVVDAIPAPLPPSQPMVPSPAPSFASSTTSNAVAPVAPSSTSTSTPFVSTSQSQPAAVAASSLFRSSMVPNTSQNSSSAPVPGPPSRRLSTPNDDDDDDEPMPQIDLGSDTDED